MFWIITFSIILLIAVGTTTFKLFEERYKEDLKFIKRSLIGIIIGGVVGLSALILQHISWSNIEKMYSENVFVLSSGMMVLCWILAALGALITLGYWIACPNNTSLKIDNNKKHIEEELKKLNFIADESQKYYYLPLQIDFKIDSINKRIAFCEYKSDKFTIYDSSNLFGLQVLENNQVVENESSGLGRAIVGGVLAGGAGAVVGVLTKKNTKKFRTIDIRFITGKMSSDYNNIRLITVKDENGAYMYNQSYKQALYFAQTTQEAIRNTIPVNIPKTVNVLDNSNKPIPEKLRELAKLKDEGIITEEEFIDKKSELLDAM